MSRVPCLCTALLIFLAGRWLLLAGSPTDSSSSAGTVKTTALPEYSTSSWNAGLGNHRAKLVIRNAQRQADGFAYAHVVWRLPGLPMESNQLLLFTEGGKRIRNLLRLSVSSEAVELIFEPSASVNPSSYILYYLPYKRSACVTGGAGSCAAPYTAFYPTSLRGWQQAVEALVGAEGWKERVVHAKTVAFQARTERDSFFPMEVSATAAEIAALKALHRPLLIWTEDRLHPIRMLHRPPHRWIERGVAVPGGARFSGTAWRDEFFAFQIGCYAAMHSLQLRASWAALVGASSGATLKPETMRCINQPNKSVAAAEGSLVPAGDVLPMWFGVEIPADAAPDLYRGAISIRDAGGGVVERVALELRVEAKVAEQHGDNELWRHSRLRWLDSTVGSGAGARAGDGGDDVGAPHRGRVGWDDATHTLSMGGRRSIRLSRLGLPASMRVGDVELLASRAQLQLLDSSSASLGQWSPLGAPVVSASADGGLRWEQRAEIAGGGCGRLELRISGELDDGGLAQMKAMIRSSVAAGGGACTLSDVQLKLPLLASQTPLINGFGWKGALRPPSVRWRWDDWVDHAQRGLNCRVWLGSASAGVQLNLQGVEQAAAAATSSCGNDENGQLQCSDLSDAQFNVALGNLGWFNQNRGSASVNIEPLAAERSLEEAAGASAPPDADRSHDDEAATSSRSLRRAAEMGGVAASARQVAMVVVSTGALVLKHESPLELQWRLMLTPVRGAGQPLIADFETRYFHMQRFTTVADAVGTTRAPWIILHQGNQLNPYINYPFLTRQPLRAYVDEAHAAGARVKLYYTVRELSGAASELWALRALRGEVLIRSSKAEGHPWLREHLRENYTAAWHEVLSDGEVDAAVQTPAFTSRWDNYWIEGILWLVRNLNVDGIYLDGAPYEFSILRRLRKALAHLTKADFKLDLHASCAGNPHLPYVELFPYLDSIWFGEQCNYQAYSPEQWLAEVSGVPFGLPGQILGNNREQWQGLVFGMTCRIYPDPHTCNPRPLYAVFDSLRLLRPKMIGWWDPACPVSSPDPRVRATLFVASDATFVIAVASWASSEVQVALSFDWQGLASLGLRSSSASVQLRARDIEGFQPAASWRVADTINFQPKGSGYNEGWLIELS